MRIEKGLLLIGVFLKSWVPTRHLCVAFGKNISGAEKELTGVCWVTLYI